jgi:5-methylcytosine-specific restriction endonuclease McrA
MNLKSKTNSAVLTELKSIVTREREATTTILHYLREVETRKLHLEAGYPNLFQFAVEELGYSAGAAQRRIQAMRLLKALPEMETKIQSGELSLSLASQVQSFFRDEGKRRKISTEEKKKTLESLLGLSTRECERKLAGLSPAAALPKEKERVITEELTQIQFLADRALLEKLEKLKGLLAHGNFEGSYSGLFHQLADLALKKLDPQKPNSTPAPNHSERQISPRKTYASPSPLVRATRFIPLAVKREVKARDANQCTYRDRITGKICESRHALEFDHRTPLSLGGLTTAENLRLLCSAHHRLETEKLATLF